MIDAIFSNIVDIKKYNPNASWYITKGNSTFEKKDASSLRPDTLRIEPYPKTYIFDDTTKTAYVLDAKFYRFGTTGNRDDLPETTSVQKQITYATHIKTNIRKEEKIERIHNAFVLPYNKNNNVFGFDNNLEYIGFSKANWVDQPNDSVVHAFLIDTKHLISSWSQGNCKDDISKLISDIEEYVTKHESWQFI